MLEPSRSQSKVSDILDCNGLSNIIKVPSDVTLQFSSLIDLFITNAKTENSTWGVFSTYESDHLPIFIVAEAPTSEVHTTSSQRVSFANITPDTLNRFRFLFLNVNWEQVFNTAVLMIPMKYIFKLLKKAYPMCFQ